MKRFLSACRSFAAITLMCGVSTYLWSAPSSETAHLLGLNLAGAEFGSSIPGTKGKDYFYPQESNYSCAAEVGFSAIRLPFRWERLEPILWAPLDADNLREIDNAVASATKHKLRIVLDMHNSAMYHGTPIAGDPRLINAYTQFWKQVSRRYLHATNVSLGLMNEPIHVDAARWAEIAQKTIDSVRQEKFQGQIVVSGVSFSGVHSWFGKVGDRSNAEAIALLRDPLNNLLIDMHQYFDSDSSGTHAQCVPELDISALFDSATRWLRQEQLRGFLGEYGGSNDAHCLSAIANVVAYLNANADVWYGSAYWASGGHWAQTYPYAIDFNTGLGGQQLRAITGKLCN